MNSTDENKKNKVHVHGVTTNDAIINSEIVQGNFLTGQSIKIIHDQTSLLQLDEDVNLSKELLKSFIKIRSSVCLNMYVKFFSYFNVHNPSVRSTKYSKNAHPRSINRRSS